MKSILLLACALMLFSSCKKDVPASNNLLIANWVKYPASPGGNTWLKITDNTNFQLGYALGPGFTEIVHGTYTYFGNTVTFNNTGGPNAYCLNIAGNYRYSLSNNQLRLSIINDACTDTSGNLRSNTLAGTWGQ